MGLEVISRCVYFEVVNSEVPKLSKLGRGRREVEGVVTEVIKSEVKNLP